MAQIQCKDCWDSLHYYRKVSNKCRGEDMYKGSNELQMYLNPFERIPAVTFELRSNMFVTWPEKMADERMNNSFDFLYGHEPKCYNALWSCHNGIKTFISTSHKSNILVNRSLSQRNFAFGCTPCSFRTSFKYHTFNINYYWGGAFSNTQQAYLLWYQ